MQTNGNKSKRKATRDKSNSENCRLSPTKLGALEKKAPLSKSELSALFDRAQSGDDDAIERVKPELEKMLPGLVKSIGLDKAVLNTIIEKCVPESAKITRHLRKCEFDLLERQLAGDNPTPIEKLLAEQVALCWLALRYAEMTYESGTDTSIEHQKWRQSRVESASRRFLAATRTLAQVRRLQIPALLQVNVGEQQVNISAGQ